MQGAIAEHGVSGQVLLLAFGSLVLFFSCWWTYFDRPFTDLLEPDTRSVFGWGYAHDFLFASLAGLGAGLEVALAYFEAHEHMSARTAGFAGFVVAAGRSGRWPSRTGSVVQGPSGRMRQWRRHESPYPESRSRVRLR